MLSGRGEAVAADHAISAATGSESVVITAASLAAIVHPASPNRTRPSNGSGSMTTTFRSKPPWLLANRY